MPSKAKKTSLNAELFWDRFEKSGSIQAYLRFHQARQAQVGAPVRAKKAKAKSAPKAR